MAEHDCPSALTCWWADFVEGFNSLSDVWSPGPCTATLVDVFQPQAGLPLDH